MKKQLVILLSLIFLLGNCCKKECVRNVKSENKYSIHYDRYDCYSDTRHMQFNTADEFISFSLKGPNCGWSGRGIPIPLNFSGLILFQQIRVPYVGKNGGDPSYKLDVELIRDSCNKKLDFNFILNTIDTSRNIEHTKTVLVVLEGVDSTYQVNFNHEIIPYKQ